MSDKVKQTLLLLKISLSYLEIVFWFFLTSHSHETLLKFYLKVKIKIAPFAIDTTFNLTKLKALQLIQVFHYNFVFVRIENIEGEGKNTDNQHFLLFLTMFFKDFFHFDASTTDSF